MESVSVRELKNNPSGALRHAREGEMVVVTNRDTPEALLVGLDHLRVPDVKRLRMALAASLFRDGVITTGTAARIAGVGRADMFETLSMLGIGLDGNASDVAQDTDVIHAWLRRTKAHTRAQTPKRATPAAARVAATKAATKVATKAATKVAAKMAAKMAATTAERPAAKPAAKTSRKRQ